MCMLLPQISYEPVKGLQLNMVSVALAAVSCCCQARQTAAYLAACQVLQRCVIQILRHLICRRHIAAFAADGLGLHAKYLERLTLIEPST